MLISKGLEPADEEDAFLASILDKTAMLQEQPTGPRLILVGGSNVAFGFDTQRLAGNLGLSPVNFGLHAALGLYLPLNFVEEHVAAGDVVVLSFEYEVIASTTIDGNPSYIKEVLGYWPVGKKYGYSEFDWKRFLDREALDLFHGWANRGRRRLKQRRPEKRTNIYRRSSFDVAGDMIGHHGKPSPGFLAFGEPGMDVAVLQRAISKMNQFCLRCKKKGAKVYFSFPPTLLGAIDQYTDKFLFVHEMMASQLTMPIINSPFEMTFCEEDFFDTQYHLTESASKVRTERVRAGIERHSILPVRFSSSSENILH